MTCYPYVNLVAGAKIRVKAFSVPRSDPTQLQACSQLYKWDLSRLGIRDQKGENKQPESLQKHLSPHLWPQVHDFGIIPDGGDLHNKKGNQQVHAELTGHSEPDPGDRCFFAICSLSDTYFKIREIPQMV